MKILHVLNVEKIRDGGSLVIAFQADDSCEYWLMLSIDYNSVEECYRPKLVNRTAGIEVDLSWQDMEFWIYRIAQMFRETTKSMVFSKIEEIVRATNA